MLFVGRKGMKLFMLRGVIRKVFIVFWSVIFMLRYELPVGSREGIDNRGYIGRDSSPVRVDIRVGSYGGHPGSAGSYRELTSDRNGALNYQLVQHGGVGRDYSTAEGFGQTQGLGGSGINVAI